MNAILQNPYEQDFHDLPLMADASNYRGWALSLSYPHMGRRVLEVGAGIGTYSEFLTDRDFVGLLDASPLCCYTLRQDFKEYRNVKVFEMDICSDRAIELAASRFDTIVSFDVLEHIADDRTALRNMNRLLPMRGILVLKVPAMPFLYGSLDIAFGHYRRYRRSELISKLRMAGFEPCFQRYMNVVGIAGWWVNSRLLRRTRIDARQLLLFDRRVVPLLRSLEARLHPPIGQSLFVVSRKVEAV